MPTHLADFVVEIAEREPGKSIFTFLYGDGAERSITAGQLHREARGLSTYFREQGVQAGEILPLVFDHGYELLAAFWGAIYLGAVPTILPYVSRNTQTKSYLEQVRRLVHFTSSRHVVTAAGLEGQLDGLAEAQCRLVALAAEAFSATEDDSRAWRQRSPAEPPYIQFSSGTTGSPKGVVLSQSAVLQYERVLAEASAARDTDVMVGWLPLYHDMGLTNQVLRPLSVGHPSVMMSPAAWLREPHLLFQAIHRFRGTVTWMPNFAFSYCSRRVRDEQIRGVDLSSWRLLGNASEPVFLRDLEEFARHFATYGFRAEALTIAYGLAEHVAAVTHTRGPKSPVVDWVRQDDLAHGRATPAEPSAADSRPIVSCGAPIRSVRLRIVDDAGSDLPPRQVGEVLVQGPCVFGGYYANPEETAAALDDGWLRTGDLGYLADGELFVCGRRKDLIILGGRNLHPNHLEEVAALILGERCRFAAAFGVPNPRLGTESPVVICEMRELPDAESQPRMRREISERLQQSQGIFVADVHFVDSGWLLKTTSGKINRAASRDKYLAERGSAQFDDEAGEAPPHPLTSTESRVLRIWESLFQRRGIGIDDDFFALGGDSLLAAELAVEIEAEFQRILPATALLETATVASLARLLDQPDSAQEEVTLVPLRPARAAAALPPLFCVHGLGGGVLGYRPLSQALGAEQPFYGLQARGLYGHAPIESRVQQMASTYLEAMREAQPEGPYHLGGYCFGGLVAFEMARQLEAAGQPVALLAIFEGFAPSDTSQRSPMRREWRLAFDFLRGLPFWVRDYLRLERIDMRARNRRLPRLIGKRLLRLVGARVELDAADMSDGVETHPARLQRMIAAHLAAARDYEPGRYGGRVVLFRTPRRLPQAPSWDMGWGELTAKPVDVQVITGAHATILVEPHVQVLAEKLAAALRQPR